MRFKNNCSQNPREWKSHVIDLHRASNDESEVRGIKRRKSHVLDLNLALNGKSESQGGRKKRGKSHAISLISDYLVGSRFKIKIAEK